MLEVSLVARERDDHVRVSSTLQLLHPRLSTVERLLRAVLAKVEKFKDGKSEKERDHTTLNENG